MDLQGNPINPGRRSTKVTQDPSSTSNPINEASGPVANDSLAAESVKSGGGYSQNRGAEPLGVSGGQSTLANTDTSGATKLSSAPDSVSRGNLKEDKYPEALGGQGSFPGATVPETGYVGGSTAAKKEMGIETHAYPASQKGDADASGSGYRSRFNGGDAPSYVQTVTTQMGNTKPNGKNLREGGFNDNPKINASFNSEIGSMKDPGRLAENRFERTDAERGPDVSGRPIEKGIDNQTWYQPLERDQRA